jgi:predicted RNA-binding protein with PIN domain
MSLQYVIDGYNIIHHPLFARRLTKQTKDLRLLLLDFIRTERLCGSARNTVTVVFDGYPDAAFENIGRGDIKIVFSRDQSADEYIRKKVEGFGSPRNLIVVSDDKEIKLFVKAIGVKAMSVEEFIGTKVKPQKNKDESFQDELTFTQKQKINEELRNIWLK